MKEKNKVTKENIIKSIANQTNKNVTDVKEIYNTFENIIFDTLSSVNEEQDVYIKLFEGVVLEGIFVEEHTKRNNLTGKVDLIPSKIKPKFNITRTYCNKLNSK